MSTRLQLSASLVPFAVLAVLAAFANAAMLAFDEPLSTAIRGDDLVGAFRVVTTIGATEVAIGVATAVAVLLWRRNRLAALVYPLTLVVGAVLNIGLKAAVGRPRPPAPDTGVSLASFPSGHTLQATLLLGLLPMVVAAAGAGPRARRAATAVAVAGIAAVGLSRVYLGAHWPTDVVGGVLVGLALIAGARHVLGRQPAEAPSTP